MNKAIKHTVLICVSAIMFLTSCGQNKTNNSSSSIVKNQTSSTTVAELDEDITEIPSNLEKDANTLAVSCVDGSDNCWVYGENVLTFSNITSDTLCSVSGKFDGQIIIDVADEYKFELELCDVTLYNGNNSPITVLSGDKITLTAKKDTENYIYDTRDKTDENDQTVYSSCVYSACDLDIGGKGTLTVISANNNGIHSKGDLEVKNLTLNVTCQDNSLKGNDSVSITGGVVNLIAKSGDCIKTSNTDISSKGKQRGNVSVTGGTVSIYAALDGIDAAYNVDIQNDTVINIFTDKYSAYSDSVQSKTGSAETADKDEDYDNFKNNDEKNMPNSQFENIAFEDGFEMHGGRGKGTKNMPNDGNNDKSEYSAKGIKADNEITVSGGTVTVSSYDDSLHTNNDSTLENGATPTGDIEISGGTLTLLTNDDGIHADGTLTVSGGIINITESYEGLEGNFVKITDGDISIISSDDGINSTSTSGTGITFEGGNIYIYAGGDGVDSNSRTEYKGIVFNGGDIVIVSNSGGDSSIDTEQGYEYNGGSVLAVCPANGMGNEATNCNNFSKIATKATMNLNNEQTLSVKVDNKTAIEIKMPCSLSALVIYLGSANASFK